MFKFAVTLLSLVSFCSFGMNEMQTQFMKNDKEFMSIQKKFCKKGFEGACNVLNCIEKNDSKACGKMEADAKKMQGDAGMKDFEKHLTTSQKKELKQIKSGCESKGDKHCMSYYQKVTEFSGPVQAKLLKESKKKCAKGEVEHCYSAEMQEYSVKKIKAMQEAMKAFQK